MKPPKTYRFFYHYRKHEDSMSVHFRGQCYPVDFVDCCVRNKTKRNKTQPRVVQQGFASEIMFEMDINGTTAVII